MALTSLVRRAPKLALAVDEVTYKTNVVLRGMESLPVAMRGADCRPGLSALHRHPDVNPPRDRRTAAQDAAARSNTGCRASSVVRTSSALKARSRAATASTPVSAYCAAMSPSRGWK